MDSCIFYPYENELYTIALHVCACPPMCVFSHTISLNPLLSFSQVYGRDGHLSLTTFPPVLTSIVSVWSVVVGLVSIQDGTLAQVPYNSLDSSPDPPNYS